jgi:signal transduction histidine kinase
MLVTPGLSQGYIVGWLRWATAAGGGVGVMVGFLERRAIENALEAQRARVAADHIENQRETLDYLNSLLRHEVLNSINVIQGHSQYVAEKTDDSALAERHIEPIVRRSHDIAQIVSDVRTLMQVLEGVNDLTAIDVHSTVDREVAKVQDAVPEAEVSVTLPEGVYVQGDDLIGRIYGNVLFNAVEHNDSDLPRITVEGWQSDGDVVVEISDNGPGIDAAAREELFERPSAGPSDHGFGLYIVDRLCNHYEGSIELAETGAEGTTFAVTLPAASPPAEFDTGTPFTEFPGRQTSPA